MKNYIQILIAFVLIHWTGYVFPQCSVSVEPADTSICSGESVTLTATDVNGNGQFIWSPANTLSCTTCSNPVATPSVTTTYTLSEVGCDTTQVTVTVHSLPTATISGNDTICSGQSTNLTISLTGTSPWSFTYTDGSVHITVTGITSSSYLLPVSPITTTTYSLESVSDLSCSNTSTGSAIVIVNPRPTATITSSVAGICFGDTAYINGTVTATGAWQLNLSPGGLAEGFGNGTFSVGVSPDTTTIYTITSLNDSLCYAIPSDINSTQEEVIVNPAPTVSDPADQTVCNGANTTSIIFTGNADTYNWINDNPSIGLDSSGTGTIPSFIATNSDSSTGTANITVTPVKLGCSGAPQTFTITVNPTPSVSDPSDQTVCNGASTIAVNFIGSADTYNWVNDNPTIGLVSSGAGNILPFIATNTDSSSAVANITVTPLKLGCPGSPQSFTITVKPSPTVDDPDDQTVCNGDSTKKVKFKNNGTTYNWTNSDPSIGLASSGTGTIFPFVATNTTTQAVVATITVTPVKDGCTGAPQVFTITVNPKLKAKILNTTTTSICNGSSAIVTIKVTASGTWVLNLAPSGSATGFGNDTIDISVSPVQNTTYTISDLSAGNCNALPDNLLGSKTVTVNPQLTAAITSSSTIICDGSSTNITGTIDVPGIWTLKLSSSDTISGTADDSTFSISVSPSISTTYIIDSLFSGSCFALQSDLTGSETVTVNPRPTATITSSDSTICNGSLTHITGTVTATGTWLLNLSSGGTASGTASDSTFSIPVSPTATTAYNIDSLISGSCSAFPSDLSGSDTVTVITNLSATITSSSTSICSGTSTTITGIVTTSGDWTLFLSSGDSAIGTDTNTFNISVSPSDTTIYTISSLQVGLCYALPDSLTGSVIIQVKPAPTVNDVSDQTICNDSLTATVIFISDIAGTTFSWSTDHGSIGLNTQDSTDVLQIPSFAGINNGVSPIPATIIVTPEKDGCPGQPDSFLIIVNPIPTVSISTVVQTVCNGFSTDSVNFSGIATSFNWVNNNSSIGLPPSGSGNITPFVAINPGNIPVFDTLTVTPLYNGCAGTPQNFTITVNPTPTVFDPPNQTFCNGDSTGIITFSGTVDNTIYTWFNSDTSIGLNSSGADSIGSFLATNTTDIPITATITITPEKDGCVGPSQNFDIIVNPSPKVIAIADGTYCNGVLTNEIFFSSVPSGPDSIFYWSNNNTAIGLASTDLGYSIPGFVASNTGIEADSAEIVFYAKVNGCIGPKDSFNIVVNPSPPLPEFYSTDTNNVSIDLCGGSENMNFNVISPQSANGVTYVWSVSPGSGIDIGNLTNPNTVISFNDIGTYTVTVVATNDSLLGSCTASESQIVQVTSDEDSIAERAIILKEPGNLLVYPDNSLNITDGYQWGYDSIFYTINPSDTLLGTPHAVKDQVYQVFAPDSQFITAGGELDTMNYAYWVLLKRNSCISKVYYNGPYAHLRLAHQTEDNQAITVDVYPNPNDGTFIITLRGDIYGSINTRIYNILGSTLYENTFMKIQSEAALKIENANFPDGIYMLELLSSDNQKVTARIIITN